MGIRGRQSTAALSVIGPDGVETVRRPEPPDELTAEQAEEWRSIVNRLPADWFPRETLAMLAQYCRHVVHARRIVELIERATMVVVSAAADFPPRVPILKSPNCYAL